MSQENVDLVRRAFNAVVRGDYRGADREFHADAVWQNTTAFPGPRTCVGPRAIVDFWLTLSESFQDGLGTTNVERVVEGEDSVVLGVHSSTRGIASGVPIEVDWCAAVRVRDGRVSRVDVHGDWEKALEAVGLGE
jgi:ketosteroid isomerase-like protein